MEKDTLQIISLVISVFSTIAMILLFIFKKNGRLFYLSMGIGWLSGIIYYIGILYFYNQGRMLFQLTATEASALLRTFQYFIFGTWFILDALEITYNKIKCKKFKKLNLFKRSDVNYE